MNRSNLLFLLLGTALVLIALFVPSRGSSGDFEPGAARRVSRIVRGREEGEMGQVVGSSRLVSRSVCS